MRTAAPSEREQARVVHFRIQGMATQNCPLLVKAAVKRVAGVTRVDASLETKSAEVEYLPSKTSAEAIRQVIKDRAGFDAVIVQ